MDEVLVSVVVPMYNVQKYAAECIESILVQTHSALEVFLVNDGSKDRTPDICREYADKDSRIVFIDKENGGPSSCRLEGFKRAKGKYIYFADSDDILDPTLIEKLLNACEKNNAEIAVCGYRKFEGVDAVFKTKSDSEIIEKADFNEKIVLPTIGQKAEDKTDLPSYYWNHIYRTDCLSEDCFISDKICTREDAYTNLAVLDRINRIAVVDEILYNYRISANSITVSYRENRLERELYYIAFVKEFAKERNLECDDRITVMTYGAAYGNIDNFCKSGSYKVFKNGLEKMYANAEINEAVKKSLSRNISSAQKVTGELYTKRATLALYNFRKLVFKSKGIG